MLRECLISLFSKNPIMKTRMLIVLPMILLAMITLNARAADPTIKVTTSVDQLAPPDSTKGIALTLYDVSFLKEIIRDGSLTPKGKMQKVNDYMNKVYMITLEPETLDEMLQKPPEENWRACCVLCNAMCKWYRCGDPEPSCVGL